MITWINKPTGYEFRIRKEVGADKPFSLRVASTENKTKPGFFVGFFETEKQARSRASQLIKTAKEKYNPWAVCHTTVDKEENPEKFERCVKKVKKQQATKKTENDEEMEREGIARGLHDAKSDTIQAVVDGSPTEEADNNVRMVVLLDRKESSGSSYSPLYWVERMYQAATARLFPGMQEAYDATIIQAKAKGLSDKQEMEIRKWLAAMGFGVEGSEEALEKRPLDENGGSSVIEYKERQVQAGFSVAEHALKSLKKADTFMQAMEKLGSVLATYKKNKEYFQAEVRVAELLTDGFSTKEVAKACKQEGLAGRLVASALLRKATMEIEPKFRVVIKDKAGSVSAHYVIAENEVKAKEQVKACYSDPVEIVFCEKDLDGQKLKKWEDEQKKGLVQEKKGQAIPPKPTTDAGPNRQWVWNPDVGSWVAMEKPKPGL